MTALPLLRRWVNDYFNRHDDEAARAFIAPEYTLRIGDAAFAGRDTRWLPAVAEQMKQFPGLGMTVHKTIAGPTWAAAWFSEHGASGGLAAAWSGIAIYVSDGERLTGCIAQEDYFTRARQLKAGVVDPIDPPAVAPWDVESRPANPDAEAIVRDWLIGSWPRPDVVADDDHITGTPLRFETRRVEIDAMFSSGADVAFHARLTGLYLGGLPGFERSTPAALHVNGLVEVVDGRVSGRIIRDRMGLRAALRGAR